MSAKNSIQVAIKVRPPSKKEKDQQLFWRVVDNSIQLSDSQSEPYYFDHIFDQNANNQVIFDTMAKQIVHSAIQGFNGTIFAYGQTSSGKTYTMMGDESNPGVMVLAAKEIFKEIERTADRQFLLRVGYIEIYNEKIYDLLNKKNQDLKIHETSTGIVSVNCEEIIIRSQGDLLTYLERGGKERTVGETNMNERSSRSHAIFRIIVESRKMERTEDDAVIQSVINLVDLAGSERADQTGARGARLKEGGHINKSLLFLSNVIKRLSENDDDDKYISFRDSKLTRILQASLGGNALTAIICTIKPNAIEETQSTLNFALRAKAIKNKPEVNEIISDATMMKRLENEIKVLKIRLAEEQLKNKSQIKVRQLEQRIKDEDLKIISCNSIRNHEKRRRTWCPSSTNLDASTVNQQNSAIPLTGSLLASGIPQPSRLQPPKTSYYNTPHITVRTPKESPQEPQSSSVLPIPTDCPEIDEEFAPAESVNFEMLSPINTPRNVTSTTSITPKLIGCEQSTLKKIENDFEELQSFTNWENKVEVEPEPVLTLKHKVETLTQRNAELEKERCKYLLLKQEIEIMTENLTECQSKVENLTERNAQLEKERHENLKLKQSIETASESLAAAENRCDKLQIELGKLTTTNKTADEKIAKYEAELAELKKTNERLEIENREAVNLEFEFKSYKNKSKLRENELLEAITDKEKQIKKLEKSINVLSAERLQNAKEELLQRSLNEDGKADENGKVCIKCEDLQRLLEENKKIALEFEKLTLECEKYKINEVEMKKEHDTHKLKIVDLEELQEKEKVQNEKLLSDIEQLQDKLAKVQQDYLDKQTQFEDLQKEYEDLSNELMDNLQESDHLKEENTKLKTKLKGYADTKQQLAEIKEHECCTVPCHHDSSMDSSTVRLAEETGHSTLSQELLNKFYALADALTEIELETPKGNTTLFKATSKNSTTKSYKMYLRNILGVQKIQKEFDMQIENMNLQGSFTHHSFHIMELSGEDELDTTESNSIDMEGCDNISAYIEKLKKDIIELKMINDAINQDRLNNKALLESTEQVVREMKEQVTQLSAELLEKSMFVEKCACKSYQLQIENLEKEKADITIVYEELQEKINYTLNGSLLMNNSLPAAEIKIDLEDKLKEIEQLKLREQQLLQTSDTQTKILEEITQRCVDMEADLQTTRDELKNQENEFKENYTKLQLENLQKLELSANEYRDNMKKYNKEWEESRDQYEQTIKDMQDQINVLTKADFGIEIKPELIPSAKQAEDEIENTEKFYLDVAPESTTNNKYPITLKTEEHVEEISKDKYRYEEQNRRLEEQLNETEDLVASIKAENRTQCEEITALNTKIIQLEQFLSDAKRLHETISEENSSLKVEINNITDNHNCMPDLRVINQQLPDGMEKMQQEYTQLEKKLRSTETQIQRFCQEDKRRDSLIQNLQTKITHLTAMEEEKNKLANDFANLKEQYNQVQDKLQKAEQQIQEFCIEDSRREELMQTLQTKLVNMTAEENERKSLEIKIQELKATLNCLQEKEVDNSKEITDFKQKVDMLLQKVSDLENAESRLHLEKSDLDEKLKQTTNEFNLLQSDKLSLETQLGSLTEEKKSLLEKISVLGKEKTTLAEQLKEIKEKEAALVQKIHCLTETLEKTQNQLDANEKNMLHDREEKAKIEQDLLSLKENIEEKNKQVTETERIKEKESDLVRKLRCLTEELEKSQNQLDENEKIMLLDREEKAKIQQNILALKEEILKKNEHLTETEGKLRCLTEELEKTQNQLDEKEKIMLHDREEKSQIQQDLLSLKESIEEKNKQLQEAERIKEKEAELVHKLRCLTEELEKAQNQLDEKEKIMLLDREEKAKIQQNILALKEEILKKNEHLTETEGKLRCLTEELEKTQNQLDEKEKIMLHDREEKSQIQQDLLSLKASIEEKNKQLQEAERIKEKETELVHKLRCLTEELEQAQNQLDEKEKIMLLDREEKAKIEQDLLSLKENIEEKTKQLTETERIKEKESELVHKLRCLTEELEKAQNQLDEKEKIMLLDREEKAKIEQDLLSLKENIEEKTKQLTETERIKEKESELVHKLRCLTEELEKAQKQLDENEKIMLHDREEKAQIQQDLLLLKENIEEKNKQLKETERIKQKESELVHKLRCLTETLEKAQSQLDENDKRMLHDREEKVQVQQEILSLKQNIEEKNRQLKETEREKEKIQQDFITVTEEKERHLQKMEECLQDNMQLRNKLTKLQQQKQEQQLSLDRVRQEQNNVQQNLQKLQELSSKVAEEQKLNQELEQQLKLVNTALDSCKEDQRKTIDKNSCLQTELQATKESLSKLQQEHLNLQENLTHYQKLEEDKNKLEATLNVLKKAQNGALSSLQEEKEKLLKSLQQYEEENNEYKEKEENLKQKIQPLHQQMHEMRLKVQSYEKLLLQHEEMENILTSVTSSNEKLKEEISELTSQKDVYASRIENLTSQIEKLNSQLKNQTDEKQMAQSNLLHLKETLQDDQVSLQKEHSGLKSTLAELQLKCDSLQLSNTQLENLNKQLQQQLNSTKEKVKAFDSMQEELKTVKAEHSELQQSLKKTAEEAGRCSLALREDVNRHKQLLQKQVENYNSMKVEMETKQNSLSKENIQLSANIEELKKEKLLLEKNLREITVRNFEYDLQRQAMDATANSSLDSNVSQSPKARHSLDRKTADKVFNTSSEEKTNAIQQKNIAAERKNRRLSTHDERRRQSYWGAAYDKGTMTDSLDIGCNCIELDRKLKECERDLFIKNSQVTALNMELKNHPLKEENATLKKRLQEEQDKHRIEIKRCKSKLYEQTVKAEKAIAEAAHAKAKSAYDASNAVLSAEQQINTVLPKVVCDVEIQTDDDLSTCLNKLQGKYNDLKHICRYRFNVIKELEEKVAQKENSDGNSLPPLDASHLKIMKKQYDALKLEMNTVKEKYEHAKKVLQSRREEILKLRAQLDQNQ